jgi:hypothetical protein
MFLNTAVDQLLSFISEKTNNTFVPNEKFKVYLINLLDDLFLLHDAPNDAESPQKTFAAFMQQLTAISEKYPALGLNVFSRYSHEKAIALACVFAAQIAGMRGLLKNKDAFRNTTYINMFHRHFLTPLSSSPSHEESSQYHRNSIAQQDWFSRMANLILFLDCEITIHTHYHIANLPEIKVHTELNVKEAFESKNAYEETALEIALRYKNPEIISKILYHLHPNAPLLYATRMARLITDSKVFVKKEYIHIDNIQKLIDSIQILIDRLMRYDILNISPSSINNIYAWNENNAEHTLNPRTTPGCVQLKNYAATPKEFKGDLECAPSEIEEAFEILISILDKLKDPVEREDFSDVTPDILCTLSFQIASKLGHHNQDKPYDMTTYTIAHNKSFDLSVFKSSLAKWEFRTLELLGIIKHLKEKEDAFDKDDGKYGTLNTDLLKRWENRQQSESVPAATQAPYTPLQTAQTPAGTSSSSKNQNTCN